MFKAGTCEPACPEGYHLEDSTCQSNDISGLSAAKTISSITDATHKVDSATLTAASMLSSHDPGSVTASTLAKMLQYIRYIDIPFSGRLELTFKNHNSTYGPFGLGPKMSTETLLQIPFHPIPFRFLKFHVHSSFLVNFWDNMIFLAIIFSLLLVIVIIEWMLAKILKKSGPYRIIRILRTAVQNFSLMQFYNVFGDILLFVVLDLKEVSLVTAEARLSLFLSLLFLCIGCIIITIHTYVLIKFVQLRRKKLWQSRVENFSKQYDGMAVFFNHFKGNTFSSQSFLLLFVIRSCLFNLILGLLPEFPVLQALFILFLSVMMSAYLIFGRPFKTIVNLFQHITCEAIFLIVNTCVLIMAQLDFSKGDSYIARDHLCEVVIYSSLVFSFVPQTFLIIKVIIAAIDWFKTSRKKSSQSQMNSKNKLSMKIQKRSAATKKLKYVEYPKNSLDESSVDLTMIGNVSNNNIQVDDSPEIKISDFQTGSSYNGKKKQSRSHRSLQQQAPTKSHMQTLEASHNQLDKKNLGVSKPQQAVNLSKPREQQTNIVENSRPQGRIARRAKNIK